MRWCQVSAISSQCLFISGEWMWHMCKVSVCINIRCTYSSANLFCWVSCNDNSPLIPWSSVSSKDSLDMKALMYSKQPSLSSRSSSDESLPCTGPMALAMWNSSSAGSVIRSFRISHTKRFLVRSAMTLFSFVLNLRMKTGSLSNPLCASLSPLTQQPPTSSPGATWSHGPRIFGSASSCHVEPIPDEPPRICCRAPLQRPRRQITVTCKTGIMSEERESRVCSFTAPLLIWGHMRSSSFCPRLSNQNVKIRVPFFLSM